MTPRNDPRDKKFTFVLTDDEKDMLETVARHENRTASDWIRLAIRTAYDTVQAEQKKKPKR